MAYSFENLLKFAFLVPANERSMGYGSVVLKDAWISTFYTL